MWTGCIFSRENKMTSQRSGDDHPKNASVIQGQLSQKILGHFVKYEMPLHKKIYKLEILDGQWDLPILSELQEVLSGQFPEGRFPKDFSQTDNSPTDSSPKDSSPKGQFRKTTFPRWTVHRQFLNLIIHIFLADKKMDFQ